MQHLAQRVNIHHNTTSWLLIYLGSIDWLMGNSGLLMHLMLHLPAIQLFISMIRDCMWSKIMKDSLVFDPPELLWHGLEPWAAVLQTSVPDSSWQHTAVSSALLVSVAACEEGTVSCSVQCGTKHSLGRQSVPAESIKEQINKTLKHACPVMRPFIQARFKSEQEPHLSYWYKKPHVCLDDMHAIKLLSKCHPALACTAA